jgi:hypothetical protein
VSPVIYFFFLEFITTRQVSVLIISQLFFLKQIKAKTQPLCLSGNAEYGRTEKPLSLFKCKQGGQVII